MEKTIVKVTTKLTTDEIIVMCQKLSRRYRRPHIHDDLVSEGVLSVLERLEVNPDEYPASLYRRANSAMHSYINIKSKAVTIPNTRSAEAISKGVEYNNQTHSKAGLKTLADALSSTSVGINENYTLSVEDCTRMYENKDFIDKAMSKLSSSEKDLIKLRYFDEESRHSLSKTLGVSQKTIWLREDTALRKMRGCNNS